MKKLGILTNLGLLMGMLVFIVSCEQTTNSTIEQSFEEVMQVTLIPDVEVNELAVAQREDQESYLKVRLNNGRELEGWCIEWNEDQNFTIENGARVYSTRGSETWRAVNYFMRIKNKLRAADPELGYREIQVIIWSLIENPAFDVDKISEYERLDPRIYKDGTPQFDVQKVKDIVSLVRSDLASIKSSAPSLASTEDEGPGTILIENDGQTIMVGGETAFAVKTINNQGTKSVDSSISTCFDEEIIANVSFPNWGWTNGPISDGDELDFDIYAGAGQCDLSKGTLVGELSISYSGGTFTATYTMTETSEFTGELYFMTTTHLYVGNDPYPIDGGDYTVAPGQYGNIHDPLNNVTTDSYTITGLSGDVYFIAHADVFGFDPGS